MSLDFQQVKQQVTEMGKGAPKRFERLRRLQAKALDTLATNADQMGRLRDKVKAAVSFNANLRSAIPGDEALNRSSSAPPLPEIATLLAVDGSQINPDRHAFADYCLVNVGAIQMRLGAPESPITTVRSSLLYDDLMYTESGRITERLLALRRDLRERQLLAELAAGAELPLITLTDGPLELWVGRETDQDAREYESTFKKYLEALTQLCESGASTAGYIDKPRGDLVVRLLEIALLDLDELEGAGQRTQRKLLGVTDRDLFREILDPGERSAIFGIQTRNAGKYADKLALHFFYLKVGSGTREKAYPVRVEIPAWVVGNHEMVNNIHAVLVHQCKVLGTRTYPYLLHRSHEVAVVTRDEKNQVERMIGIELYNQGVSVGEISHKQAAKDLAGRTRL